MSQPADSLPRAPPQRKLRRATFVDPRTGERVKRWISLYKTDSQQDGLDADDDASASTPLLQPASLPSKPGRFNRVFKIRDKCMSTVEAAWEFAISATGQTVFKCTLAYFIASLSTFMPGSSYLLGIHDSKHLVATITVYYHPARSMGSILEAMALALIAFVYTGVSSILSMTVSVYFAHIHKPYIGHAIILIVFIGGGLGLIGWYKQKRNDPLVNVACALASVICVIVVTRDDAVQAGDYSFVPIKQTLELIILGVSITFFVALVILPSSGREKLKQNMVDVTDAISGVLAMITSSFLSGDESELQASSFSNLTGRQKKANASLMQNLKEAKYEHFFLGSEREYHVEAKLVQCVKLIVQSIGGLRSAAAMQFVIIKQPPQGERHRASRDLMSPGNMTGSPWWVASPVSTMASGLNPLTAGTETTSASPTEPHSGMSAAPRASLAIRSPGQIFEIFINHLGPSMQSLAYTLKEILDDLPYDAKHNYAITNNPKFRVSLDKAVEMYRTARTEALDLVYSQKEMTRNRPLQCEADWEEAAACCGYFSFSLLEVVEQVKEYLVTLDALQFEIEQRPAGRTWEWLKFWKPPKNRPELYEDDPELAALASRADELGLDFSPLSQKGHPPPESDSDLKESMIKQQLSRVILQTLCFLRRDDIRYAIKVGIGAALFALLAFLPSTRPIYSHWRLEWGLLTYMFVCSMTIGASNTTGWSRTLGTALGALLAIAAWEISDGNVFAMAILGCAMSYWTNYIIFAKGQGPMGRFIILTYNLTALYAYSLSVQDRRPGGDEQDKSRRPLILEISLHRVVSVFCGCVWGVFVTRLVWPISARRRLKDGLSLLWLRMGLIWKRDPLSVFIDGTSPSRYMDLNEEFALQNYLAELGTLVSAAPYEFELSGPFPQKTYQKIVDTTRRMLDAFHAMNVVIQKELHASTGEEALLRATQPQRAELCSRLSHLFNVLASSMKLQYPVMTAGPDLPSIDHTRDRLLATVFQYRREQQVEGLPDGPHTTDEDFGLLYTYALVTGQLSLEVKNVLADLEALFGTLDEDALRLH